MSKATARTAIVSLQFKRRCPFICFLAFSLTACDFSSLTATQDVEIRSGKTKLSTFSRSISDWQAPKPQKEFGQIILRLDETDYKIFPETVRGYVIGFKDVVKVISTPANNYLVDPVPPGPRELVLFAYGKNKIGEEKEIGLRLAALNIEAGVSISPDKISLLPLSEIEGQVQLAGGQSPNDVKVEISGTDFITVTNGFGHYKFTGVPSGIHSLKATKSGFSEGRRENLLISSGTAVNAAPFTLARRQSSDPFALFNTADFIVDQADVEVVLGAPQDAKYMMISESENFTGSVFEPLQTTFTYKFTSEGNKVLYTKFADSTRKDLSDVQTRPITFLRYVVNGQPFTLESESEVLAVTHAKVSIKIPRDARQMKIWDELNQEPDWENVSETKLLALAPVMSERQILGKFQNDKKLSSKTFKVPLTLNPVDWVAQFFTGTCTKAQECQKSSLLGGIVSKTGVATGLFARGEISIFRVSSAADDIVNVDSGDNHLSCIDSDNQKPLFAAAEDINTTVVCLLSNQDSEFLTGIRIFRYHSGLELASSQTVSLAASFRSSEVQLNSITASSSGELVSGSISKKGKQAVPFPQFPSAPRLEPNSGSLIVGLASDGSFLWQNFVQDLELVTLKGAQNNSTGNFTRIFGLFKNADPLSLTNAGETWLISFNSSGQEVWRKKLSGLSLTQQTPYQISIENKGAQLEVTVHSAQKASTVTVFRADTVLGSAHSVSSYTIPSDELSGSLRSLLHQKTKNPDSPFTLLRHGAFLSKVNEEKRIIWSHRVGASFADSDLWKGVEAPPLIIGETSDGYLYLLENQAEHISIMRLKDW